MKFQLIIRIHEMSSRNFVLSSRNFNFRSSIFEIPSRYSVLLSRNFDLQSRIYKMLSRNFELSSRNFNCRSSIYKIPSLVISCCYHEISSFDQVNSRCFIVKKKKHDNFFYIPDPTFVLF